MSFLAPWPHPNPAQTNSRARPLSDRTGLICMWLRLSTGYGRSSTSASRLHVQYCTERTNFFTHSVSQRSISKTKCGWRKLERHGTKYALKTSLLSSEKDFTRLWVTHYQITNMIRCQQQHENFVSINQYKPIQEPTRPPTEHVSYARG